MCTNNVTSTTQLANSLPLDIKGMAICHRTKSLANQIVNKESSNFIDNNENSHVSKKKFKSTIGNHKLKTISFTVLVSGAAATSLIFGVSTGLLPLVITGIALTALAVLTISLLVVSIVREYHLLKNNQEISKCIFDLIASESLPLSEALKVNDIIANGGDLKEKTSQILSNYRKYFCEKDYKTLESLIKKSNFIGFYKKFSDDLLKSKINNTFDQDFKDYSKNELGKFLDQFKNSTNKKIVKEAENAAKALQSYKVYKFKKSICSIFYLRIKELEGTDRNTEKLYFKELITAFNKFDDPIQDFCKYLLRVRYVDQLEQELIKLSKEFDTSQPRPKGRGEEEEVCTSPSFSGYIRNPHLKEEVTLNLDKNASLSNASVKNIESALVDLYQSYSLLFRAFLSVENSMYYFTKLGNVTLLFKKINNSFNCLYNESNVHCLCNGCHFNPTSSNFQIGERQEEVYNNRFINVLDSYNKGLESIKSRIKHLESIKERLEKVEKGEEYLKPSYLLGVREINNLSLITPQNQKILIDKQLQLAKKDYLNHIKSLDGTTLNNSDSTSKVSTLVFTCSYGGGHKSATQAVIKYLGKKNAHVSVLDPTVDPVFVRSQWIHKVGKFFNKKDWKNPDIFNKIILKHQLYKLERTLSSIDLFFRRMFGVPGKNGVYSKYNHNNSVFKELIRNRILMERPQVIVTTYHMDLNPIIEVAKEFNIPVIHVPTDVDVKVREPFHKKAPDYEKFKVILPYDMNEVIKTLSPLNPDTQVVKGGFPVRPEFLKQRSAEDIAKIRAKRHLDPDTKVIAIMGGGGGQDVPFVDILAKSKSYKLKTHIIVVAGNNKAFGDRLNKLKKKLKKSLPHLSIEVATDQTTATESCPYRLGAEEICKIMDIADVFISKPGGLSIGELLYRGTPMILDARHGLFKWEEYNIKAVEQNHRGVRLESNKKLESQISHVLNNIKRDENLSVVSDRKTGEMLNLAKVLPQLVVDMAESSLDLAENASGLVQTPIKLGAG